MRVRVRAGTDAGHNVGRAGGCSPAGAVTVLNFEALDVVPARPRGRGTVAEFERSADGGERLEVRRCAAAEMRSCGGKKIRRCDGRRRGAAEMTGCRAMDYLTGFFPVMPRYVNRARWGLSSACFTPHEEKPF